MARGMRSPTSVWIVRHKGARGTSYRIRWIDPATGMTRSKAAGTDHAVARIMRTNKAAELREGIAGNLPDKTIQHLVDDTDRLMAGLSRFTIIEAKAALEHLKRLVGNRRLVHVGTETIIDFRAKRLAEKVTVGTVNKAMRQIKAALTYAVDAGWLHSNPLKTWKKMQIPEADPVVTVVEPEQLLAIIDKMIDPPMRAIAITAYFQGMRRTELSNLRWSAVDLAGGVLHIVNRPEFNEWTKTRKNRTLPMHPATHRALTMLRAETPTIIEDGRPAPKFPHVFTTIEGRRYLPDYITRAFGKAAAAVGIEATIHDLRRSFSTVAQRFGVDRAIVKDLGGWSSMKTVERHYTGSVAPALQSGMAKFADGLPDLRPNALPAKADGA